ncbi:VOC family protein [Nonomuraea terrae]|uniref:VOC family protein n=1 Tax=Nonomuraea terrae TaxID=2530383 RepID=UPI0037B4CBD9
MAVQAVGDDAPRFHVDIETDDVEVETRRLLALGAREVTRRQECRILRAPGGHLMCVLPVEKRPRALRGGVHNLALTPGPCQARRCRASTRSRSAVPPAATGIPATAAR